MASTAVRSVALAVAALTALGCAGPVDVGKRSDVPDGYYVPAYYPAPYGGWEDEWSESYAHARRAVANMTLAEKTNITAGTGIFMGMAHASSMFLSLHS